MSSMSSEQEELVWVTAVGEGCAPSCLRDESILSYGSPLKVLKIEYHHVIEADFLMAFAISLLIVNALSRGCVDRLHFLLVLECAVIFASVYQEVLVIAYHCSWVISTRHRSVPSPLTYQRNVSFIELSLALAWFRSVFCCSCMGNILGDDFDQVISWHKSSICLLDEAPEDVGDILYKLVSFL